MNNIFIFLSLLFVIVIHAQSPRLEKYVDPLPRLSVLQPDNGNSISAAGDNYTLTMTQFEQKLHRDLPPTTVWGFNRQSPGPIISTVPYRPIQVTWVNNLPVKHLLPTAPITEEHGRLPPVRVSIHLHGAHTSSESDGYPSNWFPSGQSFTAHYPNSQNATFMYYHDHAVGVTRSNVFAGLTGFYMIRDDERDIRLGLPTHPSYDIPILLSDKILNSSGQIDYPFTWQPEWFGDVILANGKIWPYLEVEPRLYRFRLLNAANSRFFNLTLDRDLPFIQVGSDGGLLPVATNLEWVLLAPAERADVLIDFTNTPVGSEILVLNSANGPFPGGDPPDPDTTGQVLKFVVVTPTHNHGNSIPHLNKILGQATPLNEFLTPNTKDRYLTLDEVADEEGNVLKDLLGGKGFADEVTETPTEDEAEIWTLINLTDDTHPIHIHLTQFQILNRQAFDVDLYKESKELKFTGPPTLPDPNEFLAWKDTIRANPGEVTRLLIKFSGFTGRYIWHCHILEHEDNDMMRPLDVLAKQ